METGVAEVVEAESTVSARTRVELNHEVSLETVAPVIEVLRIAEHGEVIFLHMRHNRGGDVLQLFALIRAIAETKATVKISFGRYIMSAAATLWLWFWLRPAPHVEAVVPSKPAVIMYHRPRRMCGDGFYCFAEDFEEGNPVGESLKRQVEVFDTLFEELLHRIGWSTLTDAKVVSEGVTYQHELQHLKDAYYGNKDCVIPT